MDGKLFYMKECHTEAYNTNNTSKTYMILLLEQNKSRGLTKKALTY